MVGVCAILGWMVATLELTARGFTRSDVSAKTLNIDHPDPGERGPFCRLDVADAAPALPGVYAWTSNDAVMYIGKAINLCAIVHGARMQRAYNDYTYIPPSKIGQASSPRVRVNGLLNRALCDGSDVAWWWVETPSIDDATRLEANLIHVWNPPWNRARPMPT